MRVQRVVNSIENWHGCAVNSAVDFRMVQWSSKINCQKLPSRQNWQSYQRGGATEIRNDYLENGKRTSCFPLEMTEKRFAGEILKVDRHGYVKLWRAWCGQTQPMFDENKKKPFT